MVIIEPLILQLRCNVRRGQQIGNLLTQRLYKARRDKWFMINTHKLLYRLLISKEFDNLSIEGSLTGSKLVSLSTLCFLSNRIFMLSIVLTRNILMKRNRVLSHSIEINHLCMRNFASGLKDTPSKLASFIVVLLLN